jgi:hypothetical protein
LEDRCGIESLAEIVKTVASSRVSCDGSNNWKIFQQELILTTYSSRPGYRVAEENNEETLNTAWTELIAVNVAQIMIFRDVTLRSS